MERATAIIIGFEDSLATACTLTEAFLASPTVAFSFSHYFYSNNKKNKSKKCLNLLDYILPLLLKILLFLENNSKKIKKPCPSPLFSIYPFFHILCYNKKYKNYPKLKYPEALRIPG